jgi:hypothetical protein
MMTPPQPTESHRRLHQLVGTFEVAVEGGGHARATTRLGPGGLFVVADFEQLEGDRVVFAGHGTYGYDADESCYTMYWFDSMTSGGFVTPARGSWTDEGLVFRSEVGGRHGRYTYRFSPEGYTFELAHAPDGQRWTTAMTCHYRRV